MTGFVVRQFKGIAPAIDPSLLAPSQATAAVNCVLDSGKLRPLRDSLAVMTLPKAGTIQSIYRFGSVASDSQYWFHWAADVDVCRGPVFGDAQERTYFTGAGLPQVTDNSIALSGGTQYPMAAYTLGIPAPSTSPTASVTGVGTGRAETRLYVMTYVSAWGEEGRPCAATSPVDVEVGQTVNLSGLATAPGGNYNVTRKRIYRSVPGTLGTPYLLVADLPIATATYADTVLAASLGAQLDSNSYDMPPATLAGLTAMGNVLAGFVPGTRDIYFSEPGVPHAFPVKYSLTARNPVVGLGVFDSSWVVLTTGAPEIISGSHPESYSWADSNLPQACVSKRSIQNVTGGVIFASPDGLFLIGGGGVRNLTEGIYSRDQWRALNPSTLAGYVIDNQYIGFYNGTAGFVFNLTTGNFTQLDWYASAGYYDPLRDALFLVVSNNQLVKWDAAGTSRTQTWKSPLYACSQPVNLGRARVEAAGYPVTFKAYADGALVHTETVADAKVFTLPDEPAALTWQFEVSGAYQINSAGFAESVRELVSG